VRRLRGVLHRNGVALGLDSGCASTGAGPLPWMPTVVPQRSARASLQAADLNLHALWRGIDAALPDA